MATARSSTPQAAETSNMDQPAVLIVSDDAEFSRSVAGCWAGSEPSPVFTMMSGDLCRDLDTEAFDIAVLGSVRPAVLQTACAELGLTRKPLLIVTQKDQPSVPATDGRSGAKFILKHEGWTDALATLLAEVVEHHRAEKRAHTAEAANLQLEQQAALGRYMIDVRHKLNNALTSVLGNSELLLLDPQNLSAEASSQIETIRNMALRMHEILQRFSSLEKELTVLEKQAEQDSKHRFHAAAAGS